MYLRLEHSCRSAARQSPDDCFISRCQCHAAYAATTTMTKTIASGRWCVISKCSQMRRTNCHILKSELPSSAGIVPKDMRRIRQSDTTSRHQLSTPVYGTCVKGPAPTPPAQPQGIDAAKRGTTLLTTLSSKFTMPRDVSLPGRPPELTTSAGTAWP